MLKGVSREVASEPTQQIFIFDVNGTLLDVHALAPQFERAFGDTWELQKWFSQVLLYSEACTLTRGHAEFSTLLSLPANPEVASELERLRQAGYRLFALTNSSRRSLKKQLRSAALDTCFERAFSVDAVRCYKSAPEPYLNVASEPGVAPGNLRLVAAQAWTRLARCQPVAGPNLSPTLPQLSSRPVDSDHRARQIMRKFLV